MATDGNPDTLGEPRVTPAVARLDAAQCDAGSLLYLPGTTPIRQRTADDDDEASVDDELRRGRSEEEAEEDEAADDNDDEAE